MERIYLDHNATTPLHPEVRAAMVGAIEGAWGNPSSIHAPGRAARDVVEHARHEVASLLRASDEEIVFTSGGTEGALLAVIGAAEAARDADPRRTHVVAGTIEHPAVIGACHELGVRGFAVDWMAVDERGRLVLDSLERLVDDRTALCTLQLANHELGNLFPIAEAAKRARARGARFHSDAVQAAGKLALDVEALGVDLLTVSAHKLGGPKGVGALYLRGGVELRAAGAAGHQERGRRPGTENVLGAVGFGAACRVARRELEGWRVHTGQLRDRLEVGALRLGAELNGDPVGRVAGTSNLAFPGVTGQLLVMALDLEGVSASTGAACSSGTVSPSPVLLALGQPADRARRAVRFSLGWENQAHEVDRVLQLLPQLLDRIRQATV